MISVSKSEVLLQRPICPTKSLLLYRELVAELPFTLMHPKPEDYDRPDSSSGSHKSVDMGASSANPASARENGSVADRGQPGSDSVDAAGAVGHTEPPVDTNLIQLEP